MEAIPAFILEEAPWGYQDSHLPLQEEKMVHKNDPGLTSWIGAALRMRRIAAGLTLKEFGEQVEVSIATVARWETEENAPDAPMVEKIAETLAVLPEDFSRPPRVV